ncbi:MAG: hypothetical protein R3Y35_03600 [Clostridia bacterium]
MLASLVREFSLVLFGTSKAVPNREFHSVVFSLALAGGHGNISPLADSFNFQSDIDNVKHILYFLLLF